MSALRLELAPISAVSPSLAEVLRLCALRAGLSKCSGASSLVLGTPKAWLGTAYHEVLAAAGGQSTDESHEAVWLGSVGRQHERAQAHPLDRRFGPPERWPGYHLVRAMALMRARDIAKSSPGGVPANTLSGHRGGREQWLSAAGGRLVGRPDLIRGDAVIDYKTGDVHDHSVNGEAAVAKASYVRQLQLYAFLVKESSGRWPKRGVLLPMEGPPVEVELTSADCESVAAGALDLLDSYNGRIEQGGEAAGLASPSAEGCRWCPYQVLCPAFWDTADASWSESLGSAAVGGVLSAAPRPIHGGAALALSLAGDEGTGPEGVVGLAPLSPQIHPALVQAQAGTRVRVTGLSKRADGTVVPTVRTILFRAQDLPPIMLADRAPPGASSVA